MTSPYLLKKPRTIEQAQRDRESASLDDLKQHARAIYQKTTGEPSPASQKGMIDE